MSIKRRLFSSMISRKYKYVEYMLDHPWDTAVKKLLQVLNRNASTVYGKRFHFDAVRSPEEYSEIVPLTDSEQLGPYLEMVYENPRGGILTKDDVIWYLQTSGTTGRPKRLPVNRAGLHDISNASAMVGLSFMAQDKARLKMLDGVTVVFGAATELDRINGVPVGYASGVFIKFLGRFNRQFVRPTEDVFNIQDMDRKMEAYAEVLVKEHVTGMQGITTLSLALIRKMQNDYGPWLLRRFKGTKYEDRLRAAMNDDGTIDVETLWPDLIYFLGMGIDSSPYKQWIKETLPQTRIRELYGASEGSLAGQLFEDIDGMQLFPCANYYEFIPENEIDEQEPQVVPMTDVKKGHRYEIVITNLLGYYRYRMGDLVTIARTDPLTVCNVTRRGKIINLSGEKVSEAHVSTAITAACLKTGAELMDYTVYGKIENGLARYVIAAMFHNPEIDPDKFVGAFEETMKTINEEFRVVRETGALGPPVLEEMKSSYYDKVVRRRSHQSKPLSLATEAEIARLLRGS
ncbi:MAG: GH3 family domain-containing protein [Candidatus Thorarchaeota archaeon]